MSELMNGHRMDLRRQLLTTASMLALLGFVMGTSKALASDDGTDRPIVWIELGGQLERADYGADLPTAPFMANVKAPQPSPIAVDRPPLYNVAGDASISFQPEASDWIISASFLYGRSNGKKHVHYQPNHRVHQYVPGVGINGTYTIAGGNQDDLTPAHHESHAIVDFQAGKDFGLGLFGGHGSSIFNAGIRFAQFNSDAATAIKAKPDNVFYNLLASYPQGSYKAPKYAAASHYHRYKFSAHTHDNFRAFGPSISWNASAPFVGNGNASELTLDWGVNAALLFGRQKTIVHHQTTAGEFHKKYHPSYVQLYHSNPPTRSRDHSVVVPNLGGFAGLSFRYAAAKVSFGYRGDFFFGALDTGVDTAKRTTMGFYGPFASISVGIGG
jgi:hypothetical protein